MRCFCVVGVLLCVLEGEGGKGVLGAEHWKELRVSNHLSPNGICLLLELERLCLATQRRQQQDITVGALTTYGALQSITRDAEARRKKNKETSERGHHEFGGLRLELSSLAVQGFGRLSKLICLPSEAGNTGALG